MKCEHTTSKRGKQTNAYYGDSARKYGQKDQDVDLPTSFLNKTIIFTRLPRDHDQLYSPTTAEIRLYEVHARISNDGKQKYPKMCAGMYVRSIRRAEIASATHTHARCALVRSLLTLFFGLAARPSRRRRESRPVARDYLVRRRYVVLALAPAKRIPARCRRRRWSAGPCPLWSALRALLLFFLSLFLSSLHFTSRRFMFAHVSLNALRCDATRRDPLRTNDSRVVHTVVCRDSDDDDTG